MQIAAWALALGVVAGAGTDVAGANAPFYADIDARASAVQQKVIEWRRDIHEHPELGNRETRTAAFVAEHLRALGLEARTGVARTGIDRAGFGATAEISFDEGTPVTYNDPDLTRRMVPTLERVAGPGKVEEDRPRTVAEDLSRYQKVIPGLFVFLGITPAGQDPATAPPNHSPCFFADESALPVGVRLMANLAVDYLTMKK